MEPILKVENMNIAFQTKSGKKIIVENGGFEVNAGEFVLILGENGAGKELFAQALHAGSPRRKYPFIAVNCAAIPENLLEGILFGTSGGAYTDAAEKPGLFEKADGGTLLLDELNSMPLGLQAKLLRVPSPQV